MNGSPLGRYSDVAAAIVAAAVVVLWAVAHGALVIAAALGGPEIKVDTQQIDLAATLVLGVVLGQRATTNGASKLAAATNLRLDAIGAPPAAAIVPVPLQIPPA